jgi:hypothetical protein
MVDIIKRLQWWAAKRKAPKGMPTILSDCAEAALEIDIWKRSSDAWTQSSIDMHRRAKKAEARCERLEKALGQCRSVLAMMIDPDTIMETNVLNAYALAVAAEASARAALEDKRGEQ